MSARHRQDCEEPLRPALQDSPYRSYLAAPYGYHRHNAEYVLVPPYYEQDLGQTPKLAQQ